MIAAESDYSRNRLRLVIGIQLYMLLMELKRLMTFRNPFYIHYR